MQESGKRVKFPPSRLFSLLTFLLCILPRCFSDDLSQYPAISQLSRDDPLFIQLEEDVAVFYQRLARGHPIGAPSIYRYRLKEDEDLYTVASRVNVYQDTLSTLNRVSSYAEFGQLREILIPNVAGIFVPQTPQSDIEILMFGARQNRAAQALTITVNAAGTETYYFFPGEKYTALERSYFLGILFRLPIRRGVITSEFGYRIHPIEGHMSFHNGLDIAAPHGTDVMAAKEGTVTAAGNSDQLGKYIVISHKSGHSTIYGHLSEIAVRVSQVVRSGTVIGAVGNTGISTGPHLHFEIRQEGEAKDPASLMPIE